MGSRQIIPLYLCRWKATSGRKYEDVRKAALKANPALLSEYKDIMQEMEAQQPEDFAAIIKADPKVAPVIAKLVAIRKQSGTVSTTESVRVQGNHDGFLDNSASA